MPIEAKIIADSKNEFGNRITTMIITMPRMLLSEFNTHRMFSRNSASSRAIPFEKMVKSVEENPFIPIAFQADHRGMQGVEYCNNTEGGYTMMWLEARDKAIYHAKQLSYSTVTKQLCNRLLEPFMWHTVIVTATEWENFFALRCPQYKCYDLEKGETFTFRSRKDYLQRFLSAVILKEEQWLLANKGQAEIHMMALAEAMWDTYNESIPKELKAGEWHIPFGDNINLPPTIPIDEGFTLDEGVNIRKVKIATARCARVSYTVVGEKADEYLNNKTEFLYNKDIELHDKLAASGHWSPFEHCAKAMNIAKHHLVVVDEIGEKLSSEKKPFKVEGVEWSGNFQGFIQYRKIFKNENITK